MLKVYDDEGDEIELPTVWEICGTCRGNGVESAYLGAFTREELDRDPEFFEEYMAGGYDRTCAECKGSGKIEVVDYDRLDAALKKRYDSAAREEADYRAMCEAERRMGA